MSETKLGGVNNVTVDTKGRIGIPSKYRHELQKCNSNLVVTASAIQCSILIYPKPDWITVEKRLQKLPSVGKEGYVQRMMLSHATECKPDNNGRILLSPSLRKDMRIKKSCVLLGVINRFELWDQKIWDEYREGQMKEIDTEDADSKLKDFRF